MKLLSLTAEVTQVVGGRSRVRMRSLGLKFMLFITHYRALVHEGKGGAVSLDIFTLKNIRFFRWLLTLLLFYLKLFISLPSSPMDKDLSS